MRRLCRGLVEGALLGSLFALNVHPCRLQFLPIAMPLTLAAAFRCTFLGAVAGVFAICPELFVAVGWCVAAVAIVAFSFSLSVLIMSVFFVPLTPLALAEPTLFCLDKALNYVRLAARRC